jgi:hypothetical protein
VKKLTPAFALARFMAGASVVDIAWETRESDVVWKHEVLEIEALLRRAMTRKPRRKK